MRIAALTMVLSLFVASSQAQFIPEPTYAARQGQGLVNYLAKGDFNSDGKLDVLLSARNTSSGAPELVVFPGNGKGGFATPIVTTISGLNSPTIITAGDVNGDGIPDVVITGTNPVTGVAEFGVMLADGTDGKFKAPTFTNAPVNDESQIVLGDFNNNGKVGVVVLGSPIEFFPGNGNGTFGSPVSSTVNYGGSGCSAVADFNKDGNLDITTGIEVLLGNGNGTFQSPLTVTDGGCGVAVGDFNNDGIPDLVTGGGGPGGGTPTEVRVFLGNKTGNFTSSTAYQTGNYAGLEDLAIAVDYFSGGTDQDIAVSNIESGNVTMLLGNGTGTFTIGKSFAVSNGEILSGNFVTGNKNVDLAVRDIQGIGVLLGNGNGTFVAQIAQNVPRTLGTIHLANFTGSGKLSLIKSSGSGGPTAVLPGNGNGTFGTPIPAPASCQTENAIVGDFNGDKIPDIAFSVTGSGGGVAVCLGNGDGTFKDAVISDAGVQHGLLVIGDFNHDGKLDLAASDTGGISILLGNGDGTFKDGIATALSGFPQFTVGDFNNDGKLDIAAINGSTGEISVLLGIGNGTFKAPITTANTGSIGITSGLINSDKNLDLVTVSSNTLYIFLGNGDGTFTAPTSITVGSADIQTRAPLLRDVNGDGKLDLICYNSAGLLVVFLGNGDGTFQARKTFPATNDVNGSIAAGALSGSGLLDVVLYSPGDEGFPNPLGALIVYLNQGTPAK
ncbi:MAG: VCBS repeat-containing protein [Candidatus Sulfotelmatobacter sp.]